MTLLRTFIGTVALLAVLMDVARGAATAETGQFWRVHWYQRGLEHGNPAYEQRFRVNSPDVVLHPVFGKRVEARENGLMLIRAEEDLSLIQTAELYLEMWGGHPGTANKRVTVNGRSTYFLPRVGTEEMHCTYHYPSLPLQRTDLVNGHNAFQFAVDQGQTFWGHMLIDNAALRMALNASHPDLTQAGLAGFRATVQVRTSGPQREGWQLALAMENGHREAIESVAFEGFYFGYDENGDTLQTDWHGFTKARRPVGIIGTATTAPFEVHWDTTMLPSQKDVAVRATVRFKSQTNLVYLTAPARGLQIPERPDHRVTLFSAHDLPKGFWSRAGRTQACAIYLEMDPGLITEAELHVTAWTGGPGTVKEYFTLNGHHFPVADGSRHELIYSRLPVNPGVLRQGLNRIELLSDTEHHGIEILLPGPALMVRSRRAPASSASVASPHPMTVSELEHQGQESLKISTPSATYIYHKRGGGFASLIDRNGQDWISYRPGGGSAGEYRGIPNCGPCFHPGYTNSNTRITYAGADRVTLQSETIDGSFAGTWDIYPDRATFTLLRAGTNFWFLYEGTPGGKLVPDADYMVRSDGRRTPLAQSWSEDLPGPEWLYFASSSSKRSLVLFHHEDDDIVDQYWPMEGNMTVFGFGRQYKTIVRHLTRTPAHFTIALRETEDAGEIRQFIEALPD